MTTLKQWKLENAARSLGELVNGVNDGDIDLSPPYQRGDVWELPRRQALIKSVLTGVPIGAIILNDRFGAHFQHPDYDRVTTPMYAVIDGKQRLTTLQRFVADKVPVPSNWFTADERISTESADTLVWSELTRPTRIGFLRRPLAVQSATVDTMEREDELFTLINFGGVPQGCSD